MAQILIYVHKNSQKSISTEWLKVKKGVPILNTVVCIVTGSFLSGTKNLEYSKIWHLNGFKNFKNSEFKDNMHDLLLKDKRGWAILTENAYKITLYIMRTG